MRSIPTVKGEVRAINDRNICERRSCMKNNGKSPTFKFVSGEERRSPEVQRVSRGWRPLDARHSSADPTWIRKWLKIQAPELSELESVELELESCCSDFDKQVSDEICRTRKRQFEIPFRLQVASCPRVTLCSIPPGRFSRKRRRTDRKDFSTSLNTTNPNTYMKFIFLRTSPLIPENPAQEIHHPGGWWTDSCTYLLACCITIAYPQINTLNLDACPKLIV